MNPKTVQTNTSTNTKEDNLKTGSFTDPRDGTTYKTIEINGKIWFAENLKFKKIKHYSANGNQNNDSRYGYLYDWKQAMKACPNGWRLPNKSEFEKLIKSYSKSDLMDKSFKGNNSSGFGALPAGHYFLDNYDNFGDFGYFWSSTELTSSRAFYLSLGRGNAYVNYDDKIFGFSVRCLRD